MQAGSVATAVLSEGRYARHSLVGGWDQGAIGRATAVVAGAGALGNEAIKLLAMMGVGHLVIVDPDTVEETNLSRTVLFRAADIGLPKAEVAARRARELNPAVQVRAIVGDATSDLGLGDLARATMVLGCLDSALARWLFNRRCLAAGVEWIDGGTGERHGQVARYGPSGGACFECTMTTKTFERLEKRYRCGFRDDDPAAGVPMPSTATLSSTIAAIQVQEALHVAMGVEAPAGLNLGQRLWVYLRPYQMFVDDLPTRHDCLAHPDGVPEASGQMQAPWRTTTLDDVVQAARVIDRTADRVDLGYEVVVNTTCPSCGHESGYAGRRDRLAVASMQCPECGAARRYAGTSVIWAGDALASRPLGDLSIPPREWLSVRGEGDATTVVEVGAAA